VFEDLSSRDIRAESRAVSTGSRLPKQTKDESRLGYPFYLLLALRRSSSRWKEFRSVAVVNLRWTPPWAVSSAPRTSVTFLTVERADQR
jgi:hypothetical protein